MDTYGFFNNLENGDVQGIIGSYGHMLEEFLNNLATCSGERLNSFTYSNGWVIPNNAGHSYLFNAEEELTSEELSILEEMLIISMGERFGAEIKLNLESPFELVVALITDSRAVPQVNGKNGSENEPKHRFMERTKAITCVFLGISLFVMFIIAFISNNGIKGNLLHFVTACLTAAGGGGLLLVLSGRTKAIVSYVLNGVALIFALIMTFTIPGWIVFVGMISAMLVFTYTLHHK